MTNHPRWCHPESCAADEDGAQHLSEPRVLKLGDDQITFRLTQYVPHDPTMPPSPVDIQVDSVNTSYQQCSCIHDWPVTSVAALSTTLLNLSQIAGVA